MGEVLPIKALIADGDSSADREGVEPEDRLGLRGLLSSVGLAIASIAECTSLGLCAISMLNKFLNYGHLKV